LATGEAVADAEDVGSDNVDAEGVDVDMETLSVDSESDIWGEDPLEGDTAVSLDEEIFHALAILPNPSSGTEKETASD